MLRVRIVRIVPTANRPTSTLWFGWTLSRMARYTYSHDMTHKRFTSWPYFLWLSNLGQSLAQLVVMSCIFGWWDRLWCLTSKAAKFNDKIWLLCYFFGSIYKPLQSTVSGHFKSSNQLKTNRRKTRLLLREILSCWD